MEIQTAPAAQNKFRGVLPAIRENWYGISIFLLFAAAFLVRVIHLNYNSPFSDEAIYVVIGRMGIFQLDWFSYNSQSWMAGLPYAYPPLSAIAYVSGGIIGSRFLNVVIGMLMLREVFVLTKFYAFEKKGRKSDVAAIIAVFIVAFSAISLFVTRLATYDALSFFLLLYGMNHVLNAQYQKDGKFYFLGSLALTLAYFTKVIVAAYIPLIVALTFFTIIKDKDHIRLWKRYFFSPLVIGGLAYAFINLNGFLTYATNQAAREHASIADIAGLIKYDAFFVLWMTGFSLLIALINYKQSKNVLYLAAFASILPAIHFVTHRYSTLEKHVLLMIIFLAPIIGYAFAEISFDKILRTRIVAISALILVLGFYPFYEYQKMAAIEREWPNVDNVMAEISRDTKPDDKILTETGPAVILAAYDKTSPLNVSTFDYFEYGKFKNDDAYLQAVHDGYFDLIELNGKTEAKIELVKKIRAELGDKYKLSYSNAPFEIYERIY